MRLLPSFVQSYQLYFNYIYIYTLVATPAINHSMYIVYEY